MSAQVTSTKSKYIWCCRKHYYCSLFVVVIIIAAVTIVLYYYYYDVMLVFNWYCVSLLLNIIILLRYVWTAPDTSFDFTSALSVGAVFYWVSRCYQAPAVSTVLPSLISLQGSKCCGNHHTAQGDASHILISECDWWLDQTLIVVLHTIWNTPYASSVILNYVWDHWEGVEQCAVGLALYLGGDCFISWL